MAEEVSNKAQLVWQNILLLAYASCIAAIPLGDAFLFSFTAKKPLAVGVARSIFVSTLGASLGMIIAFAGWLISECVFPSLQLDHFFYRLVERRIKAKAFSHIIAIFVLVELVLLLLTVGLGGFLASVTTFVGEQNQNHTRFSFISLLIDIPIGLSIVSFIQAIFCALTFLIRHLKGSPAPPLPLLNESRDRLFMMNQNARIIKANRRVTFKTESDISASDSKRCSDVSGSSSTSPILQLKEGEGVRRIPSASSSRTTLLPIYHHYSSSQTNNSSIMPPCYQNPSTVKFNGLSCDSLLAPPPAAHGSTSAPVKIEPSAFSLPKILTKTTSFSDPPVTPAKHVPSAATSRYAWLKSRTNKDELLKKASKPSYTRVGTSVPITPVATAYHRDSIGTGPEVETRRNSWSKRKSVPLDSFADLGLLRIDPAKLEADGSSESDGSSEDWAEALSQISHRDGMGSNTG